VEVTWQRLPERYKSRALARHWSRFGNLQSPEYKKILTPDFYDDWRGIKQIPFRGRDLLVRFAGGVKQLVTGRFKEVNSSMNNLPRRLVLVNKKW
jgi:hypothetical protein